MYIIVASSCCGIVHKHLMDIKLYIKQNDIMCAIIRKNSTEELKILDLTDIERSKLRNTPIAFYDGIKDKLSNWMEYMPIKDGKFLDKIEKK